MTYFEIKNFIAEQFMLMAPLFTAVFTPARKIIHGSLFTWYPSGFT